MKLRPTQIVGLGAILVFGGVLVFTLINGQRDPDLLPSGVRLSDLPSIGAPTSDTTPLPADPLAVGSQSARDDLYCSGVTFAEALENTSAPSDLALRLGDAYVALAEAGRAKLEAEGAAKADGAIAASNAWADKARADYRAKALRIPLADCMKRAAALPPRAASRSSTRPDLLGVGSQAAKDDLYCSGLIYAEHLGNNATTAEQSSKQLNAILALAQAGTKKLIAEGAAIEGAITTSVAPGKATTAMVADAHTDKAKADYDTKKPRIPLATCMSRAAALPAAKPLLERY